MEFMWSFASVTAFSSLLVDSEIIPQKCSLRTHFRTLFKTWREKKQREDICSSEKPTPSFPKGGSLATPVPSFDDTPIPNCTLSSELQHRDGEESFIFTIARPEMQLILRLCVVTTISREYVLICEQSCLQRHQCLIEQIKTIRKSSFLTQRRRSSPCPPIICFTQKHTWPNSLRQRPTFAENSFLFLFFFCLSVHYWSIHTKTILDKAFSKLNKNCPFLAWLMKIGLQGTTAADISCPAVEAATQGVGMANVHLYGLDPCKKKTYMREIRDWLTCRDFQFGVEDLPRLSNIFWMVLSLASTITRFSSNIRTFMDSHLDDIHSGWSAQKDVFFSQKFPTWTNFSSKNAPSGIKGVGGFTTVQPAFLNIST